MHLFSWNEQYLSRDGKPWFPMMGEIHFSRCPENCWALELAKMKAGGVDIAATYVFWIHHEETENAYRFDGQRNLRKFIESCRDAGLYVWLRIGPWCHGEVKNGGFPDWLLKKNWELRANSPEYMAAVKRYWTQIAQQTDGLWHGQGGPIIGLQLENEYGHCGGDGDPAHMDALLDLSRELHMQPAYYSATGWGGAVLGTGQGILPVMSAYCDAPWDHRQGPLPANGNYLFSSERNDVDVGSDFRKGEHLSFDDTLYPFLTAELGGGMQATWHRRPYLIPADTGAMSLCKLGSGAALLGYYMYHGGTNPGYNLQESIETGGLCRLPELSYDYRCPIREFGQITGTLLELKLMAMFLRDYGDRLALTHAVIPEDSSQNAEDMYTPRWSYRSDGHSGFIFVNNHQRNRTMAAKTLTLTMPTDEGDVTLESLHMDSGSYGFYPVNFQMCDAVLRSAHAIPLCCLNGRTYVFYADGNPCYDLTGKADVLTLCREDALHSWKISENGRDALLVSNAPVVRINDRYMFLAKEKITYTCYFNSSEKLVGEIDIPVHAASVQPVEEHADNSAARIYALHCTDNVNADETILSIRYEGSKAEIWRSGQKVADDFYDGHAFEVSLKRLGTQNLSLHVFPLHESEEVYMDRPPVYERGVACRLNHAEVICEYHIPCPFGA